MMYASLVNSLLGIYYPLDTDNKEVAEVMIKTSDLSKLYHNIYTDEEAEAAIREFGGQKLPPHFASKLDYDSHEVFQIQEKVRKDSVAPYGYCPTCGSRGNLRERRPNGDDICERKHKYPSRSALTHEQAQELLTRLSQKPFTPFK